MSSNIIDRRLNPRDKTIDNRRRFLRRNRQAVADAVKQVIDKSKVGDITKNKAKVRVVGTNEPTFSIDPKSGNKKYVAPGNRKYVVGDTIHKPQGGGGRGTNGSPGGEGEDEFSFELTREEFLDAVFDELELPDFVKKSLKDAKQSTPVRAGFKSFGTPAQLDLQRTARNAIGRRIGLRRPKVEEIEAVEEEIRQLANLLAEQENDETRAKLTAAEQKLAEMKTRSEVVPWLDPLDVRYRNYQAIPRPISRAVMFCLMDVSGSMGDHEKDLAKRFFLLLNLFLNRKYEHVDVVFVRHTQVADVVDEQTFFYDPQTGGTMVSAGVELVLKTISDHYATDWNVYVAQASDGDNWSDDSAPTLAAVDKILKLAQYFAYVEIGRPAEFYATYRPNGDTELWNTYAQVTDQKLVCRKIASKEEIWPVFAQLFAKG